MLDEAAAAAHWFAIFIYVIVVWRFAAKCKYGNCFVFFSSVIAALRENAKSLTFSRTADADISDCTISVLWSEKACLNWQADGDKVRTKELICKLIGPNQFVAVVAANTKGCGQRDLDKEGAEPLKRPQSKFDNTAANSRFCHLKVNGGLPQPAMRLIMLQTNKQTNK